MIRKNPLAPHGVKTCGTAIHPTEPELDGDPVQEAIEMPVSKNSQAQRMLRTAAPQLALLFTLLVCALHPRTGAAADLRSRPKSATLSGRIVAKVPLERLSTSGANYESYLFLLDPQQKNAQPELVKVSYRFSLGEPQLPKAIFDYSLVHRFRMTRDEECDQPLGEMAAKFVFDKDGNFQGKQEALVYAKNAPPVEADEHATLACYVTSPRDYKSTSKPEKSKSDRNKSAPPAGRQTAEAR